VKKVKVVKRTCLLYLISTIFLSGFLFSCSTNQPSKSQYYVLNNQVVSELKYDSEGANTELISVIVKELPRYLNQANLVMQMDDHQLHYSNHHMWAEPLQRGLTKALLADVNSLASNRLFVEGYQELSSQMLYLDIERFHVIDTSQVSLSGYYWLVTQAEPLPLSKHAFNISLDLDKDGFSHAVEKMRELVRLCAQEIITQVDSGKAVLPMIKETR
jgi:hypothetical protein